MFLEGLEVVFIVLTFGVSAGNVPLAAAGSAVAGAIVLVVGALVQRPLSRVPENTIKYGVGILLSTFGTFWAIEGLGVFSAEGSSLEWPAGDLALARACCSAGSSSREASSPASAGVRRRSPRPEAEEDLMRYLVGFGRFWYEFIVGDDWRIAAGVTLVLAVGAVARGRRARRGVAAAGPRGRVRGRLRAAADRRRPAVDDRRAWWLPPPPTGRTGRIRTASPSERLRRRPETGPTTARA